MPNNTKNLWTLSKIPYKNKRKVDCTLGCLKDVHVQSIDFVCKKRLPFLFCTLRGNISVVAKCPIEVFQLKGKL